MMNTIRNPQTLTRIPAMLLALLAVAQVHAANLGADWSDVNNPNGVWTLKKNAADPFTTNQSDYYSDMSNQKAWADQPFNLNAHVPFWMKVSATGRFADALPGDIVVHGAETDRTGSAVTGIVYTAPETGGVVISGAVWSATNFSRTMSWDLLVNGVSVSSGQLVSNGSVTRSNPNDLADGSGGAAATLQFLFAGDTVELRFTSIPGDLGDAVGVVLAAEPDGSIPSPTPSPTPYDGRPFGDLDNSGCTELPDFLILLDFWQVEYSGAVIAIDDFLHLLDYWQTGPACP